MKLKFAKSNWVGKGLSEKKNKIIDEISTFLSEFSQKNRRLFFNSHPRATLEFLNLRTLNLFFINFVKQSLILDFFGSFWYQFWYNESTEELHYKFHLSFVCFVTNFLCNLFEKLSKLH